MSNAKLFRRLVPALALVLAVTSSLIVAIPAQAAPSPAKLYIPAGGPNTCYWASYHSNSNNIVLNSETIGYYSVFLEYDTCNTGLHRAEGEMVINDSDNDVSCTAASFRVDLDANGVIVESASIPNPPGDPIGSSPNNCSYGTTLDLATNYYQGSYTYCAEMRSVQFVNGLAQINAGSQCF